MDSQSSLPGGQITLETYPILSEPYSDSQQCSSYFECVFGKTADELRNLTSSEDRWQCLISTFERLSTELYEMKKLKKENTEQQ